MRRRLKVHGATRRPRRKSEWLLGSNGGCLERIQISACDDELPAVDLFSIVQSDPDAVPGSVSSVGEVTVARIVGEIHLVGFFPPQTSTIGWATLGFYEGMYIADMDSAGLAIIKSPILANDQTSGDWLWKRSSIMKFVYSSVPTIQVSDDLSWESAHFDIRVKRKMRKEEGIFYAVSCLLEDFGGGANVPPEAGVYGSNRALVLLP